MWVILRALLNMLNSRCEKESRGGRRGGEMEREGERGREGEGYFS
jgi:hypothetical protein